MPLVLQDGSERKTSVKSKASPKTALTNGETCPQCMEGCLHTTCQQKLLQCWYNIYIKADIYKQQSRYVWRSCMSIYIILITTAFHYLDGMHESWPKPERCKATAAAPEGETVASLQKKLEDAMAALEKMSLSAGSAPSTPNASGSMATPGGETRKSSPTATTPASNPPAAVENQVTWHMSGHARLSKKLKCMMILNGFW